MTKKELLRRFSVRRRRRVRKSVDLGPSSHVNLAELEIRHAKRLIKIQARRKAKQKRKRKK